MGNVVAIEQEKPAKKGRARKYSIYAEDPRAQFLLVGTNELGNLPLSVNTIYLVDIMDSIAQGMVHSERYRPENTIRTVT